MKTLAIIGGGPAGLRAAEVAAASGVAVTVFDAKSSVGRKFLVAGRGGLNLTKAEPLDRFLTHYAGPDLPRETWNRIVAEFPPEALRAWAAGLGVETFAAHRDRSELPLLVDFWAPWCGPCLMMAPNFEAAAAQLEPRVRLAKVDTQSQAALGRQFGIRSIPTLVLFAHGREIARQAGDRRHRRP